MMSVVFVLRVYVRKSVCNRHWHADKDDRHSLSCFFSRLAALDLEVVGELRL